jgi:hypothetical protein
MTCLASASSQARRRRSSGDCSRDPVRGKRHRPSHGLASLPPDAPGVLTGGAARRAADPACAQQEKKPGRFLMSRPRDARLKPACRSGVSSGPGLADMAALFGSPAVRLARLENVANEPARHCLHGRLSCSESGESLWSENRSGTGGMTSSMPPPQAAAALVNTLVWDGRSSSRSASAAHCPRSFVLRHAGADGRTPAQRPGSGARA